MVAECAQCGAVRVEILLYKDVRNADARRGNLPCEPFDEALQPLAEHDEKVVLDVTRH